MATPSAHKTRERRKKSQFRAEQIARHSLDDYCGPAPFMPTAPVADSRARGPLATSTQQTFARLMEARRNRTCGSDITPLDNPILRVRTICGRHECVRPIRKTLRSGFVVRPECWISHCWIDAAARQARNTYQKGRNASLQPTRRVTSGIGSRNWTKRIVSISMRAKASSSKSSRCVNETGPLR